MFKVLVLQKYHGLSEEGTEKEIGDRLSFLSFLDLRLGDQIPDANTIWDFKELIEKEGRSGSRQRNSREQNQEIKDSKRPERFGQKTAKGLQKDRDARWTKKNNESHYGYKNHAKVDAKSKLIDAYQTPPAQVHDSQVFRDLVDHSDKAVERS